MAWYGMAWRGMVWYGMVWYGVVWRGMVWRGMAWHGMAWHGMAWHGMAWLNPLLAQSTRPITPLGPSHHVAPHITIAPRGTWPIEDNGFYPVRSAGMGGRLIHGPMGSGLVLSALPAERYCSGHLVWVQQASKRADAHRHRHRSNHTNLLRSGLPKNPTAPAQRTPMLSLPPPKRSETPHTLSPRPPH